MNRKQQVRAPKSAHPEEVAMKDKKERELLTLNDVAYRLSMSVATARRLVEQGKLPQPIRFGVRLHRWRLRDIQQYLDDQQSPPKK